MQSDVCATDSSLTAGFPLTHGQKSLWFLQQMLPASAVYHLALAVRVLSDLDIPALRTSLQTIVDRHESLRTVVAPNDHGELLQKVRHGCSVAFKMIDIAGLSEEEVASALTDAYRSPFDLADGPLFRAHLFTSGTAGNHLLLIAAHHLVFDALSLGVVFSELLELYRATVSGKRSSLLPIGSEYRDFVEWQTRMLAGPEGEAHLAFWREQLDGAPPVLDFPTDHPRPSHPRGLGGSLWFSIENNLIDDLKKLTCQFDVSSHDMFAAAWNLLLYRYSSQPDVTVGFVTGGRPHLRYGRTTGSFSNTIPLRTRFEDDPPFAELLRRVHETLAEGLTHQDYPFPLLVERIPAVRVPGYMPLTQVLFTYFMARGSQISELFVTGHEPARVRTEAFELESYGLRQEDLEFDLAITVAEGKRCWCRIRYDSDLFEPHTIRRLARHYVNLLEAVAADPSRRVSSVPLLSRDERNAILLSSRPAQIERPDEATFCRVFRSQVAEAPERVAVICGDCQLQYRELKQRAEGLAAQLRRRGAQRGELVGVCLERSAEMLVALLAVWMAGGAYVPLDPSFPRARVDLIVEDAAPRFIITEPALQNRFSSTTLIPLDAGSDIRSGAHPVDSAVEPSNSDLAYVLYTSGTTGTPKGVEIPHGALANLLLSMLRRPGMNSSDVLLAVTTISFDISGLELFLPLMAGATVVIARREATLDGERLAREIKNHGVTVMQATPATWRLLLDSGWPGSPHLKALCGGEAWPPDLAAKLRPRVASLWNMYGPTETTVWSAVHEVSACDDPIPLGVPIYNTSLYILDPHREPVPAGVAGELYIGGAGLARGYRNLPEMTADRFIENPFVPGERLYKTGDLCRYRSDGSLIFLGRLDDQVKLRGHRVELGDIESALLSHPVVSEAAVVMIDRPGHSKRLVAYLVTAGTSSPAAGLREFLSAQLPDYMIPSAFVWLDALPLTPGGKIDRLALRARDVASAATAREYVSPRTATEALIASLWSEILKVPRAGAYDRFDELGGDSLSFALMTVRAGSSLGIRIPVRMDGDLMTVAGFARMAERISTEFHPSVRALPATPASRPEPIAKTWYGQILIGMCRAIVRGVARIEVEGYENLPASGPAIVAGNHISLFDFAFLGSMLFELKGSLSVNPTFVIADKWRWLARPFVSQLGHAIYIRRGQGDMEALEAAREVLRNNGAVAIAPEGRPTRGALTRARSGVGYLACESGAPVWPMAIFGHERILDYWTRLRRVPVRIRFGTRLMLRACERGDNGFQQRADRVMTAIAELMPPEYHGVYSDLKH